MPLDGCHPLQLSTTQKRAFAHDVSLLNIELLRSLFQPHQLPNPWHNDLRGNAFSATDATSLV
jgi:hypothetical protein